MVILAKFTVLGDPQALKRHQTKSWICPVCHGQKFVPGGKCRGCFGRGIMSQEYDPSAKDKAAILTKVKYLAPPVPLDEPLKVVFIFFMPRIKGHYGSGKNSHQLKPHAPLWCRPKPDLSNLVKLIEDALNGVFWKDDSIICREVLDKVYSERPRVEVEIYSLTRKG